jgi:hypothetical protein
MASTDTYTSLIALLDEHGAQYRLIDHPPEGRTELVRRRRQPDVRAGMLQRKTRWMRASGTSIVHADQVSGRDRSTGATGAAPGVSDRR